MLPRTQAPPADCPVSRAASRQLTRDELPLAKLTGHCLASVTKNDYTWLGHNFALIFVTSNGLNLLASASDSLNTTTRDANDHSLGLG
mmetsp:Transcript_119924/g.238770  ORF Transcript_119924/g.238770 Transcript_119924/m.238770 type:complete len:88 (-) Transcript_119924:421-684(-)